MCMTKVIWLRTSKRITERLGKMFFFDTVNRVFEIVKRREKQRDENILTKQYIDADICAFWCSVLFVCLFMCCLFVCLCIVFCVLFVCSQSAQLWMISEYNNLLYICSNVSCVHSRSWTDWWAKSFGMRLPNRLSSGWFLSRIIHHKSCDCDSGRCPKL